ncbi:MAG: ABC transporter permease [Candidatus Poseidoniaceae archaeon]|nr:ABC transporter permease [Candidatus Poseidoniaceae archaeon]MBL6889638.1 ABC transporter permease [Candidatus Poseidoniaceae archaeon]
MVSSSSLWDVAVRTVVTSGTATLIAAFFALGFALLLANTNWRGKEVLRVIVQALYGLPPVVVGVMVYLALSKDGLLSDLNWLFTIEGMIFAQTLLIFPLILGVAWGALERVSEDKRDVFRVMNVKKGRRIMLEMYCARRGIVNAILLGFGRAIAEVGAVLMVGGNIAGKTRVLTTSVVLETSIGEMDTALQLGGVLLVLSLLVALSIQLLQRVHFFGHGKFGDDNRDVGPFDDFDLNLENLNVEKDGNKILNSYSINLKQGEIIALMGESGSGKSTLLRKICGLEGGDLGIGHDVAYVAQQPTLVMDTVAMELQLPIMVHNHLPNAGKELAVICGLEEKERQRTDTLSGGEKQRLAFLRALAMNRKILVLDEFTSELDGLSVEKIENEVLKFKQRGGCVLFATHNVLQAQRLATRTIFIHQGQETDAESEIAQQIRSGKWIG